MTDAPLSQAAQAEALREQRVANQIDESDFHARMGALFADSTPAPAAPPVTAAQAEAQIAELRKARLENKVTDRAFFEQMERLGAIASGEAPAGNTSGLQLSPEVAAEVEAATTPPPTPQAYRFDYREGHNTSPESMKWDAEVRTAFHTLGLPQHIAAPVFLTVNELAAKFDKATPEQIADHSKRVAGLLRTEWGDQYETKLAAVDALIDGLPDGRVTDALRGSPWLIGGDVGTMTRLAYFAEQRARRRGAA